jgi:hypothetical protein
MTTYKRVLLTDDIIKLKIASKKVGTSFDYLLSEFNNGVKQIWFDDSGNKIASSKYDNIENDIDIIIEKIDVEDSFIERLNNIKSVKRKKGKSSYDNDPIYWKFNIKKTKLATLAADFIILGINPEEAFFHKSIETEYVWVHKETKMVFMTRREMQLDFVYTYIVLKKYIYISDTIDTNVDIVFDVDIILDKISKYGVDSLYNEEKEFLDNAYN